MEKGCVCSPTQLLHVRVRSSLLSRQPKEQRGLNKRDVNCTRVWNKAAKFSPGQAWVTPGYSLWGACESIMVCGSNRYWNHLTIPSWQPWGSLYGNVWPWLGPAAQTVSCLTISFWTTVPKWAIMTALICGNAPKMATNGTLCTPSATVLWEQKHVPPQGSSLVMPLLASKRLNGSLLRDQVMNYLVQ